MIVEVRDQQGKIKLETSTMSEEEICRFLTDAGINFQTAVITKTISALPKFGAKRVAVVGERLIRRTK